MHELALAQGIVAVALDAAGTQRVERVKVRVGSGQRVDPDSLRFCFALAARETSAADATLEVEVTDGVDAMVEAVKVPSGWRHRPHRDHVAAPES